MANKRNQEEKLNLHPRNRNRKRYELSAMTAAKPELLKYIQPNKLGLDSIDFSDPRAVKILNQAILKHYYGLEYWEFPNENLCPPIPGRAEYIHHIADLLSEFNKGEVPRGEHITCLDIGVGASCIYPIIGITEYNWNFIGSDTQPKSIESALNIAHSNPSLKGKFEGRIQDQPKYIFRGLIKQEDKIDISICNPPFHASLEEATRGTRRKVKNLTGKAKSKPRRNFSGNHHELVYEGGEFQFISRMISESKEFAKSCFWFSSLVSKESELTRIYTVLDQHKPSETRTIHIKTGNKTSRILAWSYLEPQERKQWRENKWT